MMDVWHLDFARQEVDLAHTKHYVDALFKPVIIYFVQMFPKKILHQYSCLDPDQELHENKWNMLVYRGLSSEGEGPIAVITTYCFCKVVPRPVQFWTSLRYCIWMQKWGYYCTKFSWAGPEFLSPMLFAFCRADWNPKMYQIERRNIVGCGYEKFSKLSHDTRTQRGV